MVFNINILSNHNFFFLINCLIGNASKNSFAINIEGSLFIFLISLNPDYIIKI